MNINLYPFNQYILYAAIIAVVVMLGVVLASLLRLVKVLNSFSPALKSIAEKSETVKGKSAEAMAFVKETAQTAKLMAIGSVLFSLIKKEYDKVEENGVKGVKNAAVNVAKNSMDSLRLLRTLRG